MRIKKVHTFLSIVSIVILFSFEPASASDDDWVRLSEAEARKILVSKVDPEYPLMAKQIRLSGKVQVDCFVNTNGAVEKVQILNGNPLFSSSITNAMKKWKFKPTEANGKAARMVNGGATARRWPARPTPASRSPI